MYRRSQAKEGDSYFKLFSFQLPSVQSIWNGLLKFSTNLERVVSILPYVSVCLYLKGD